MYCTCDVLTSTDIAYGKNPKIHLSQISPVFCFLGDLYLDARYSRTVYAIAILTSPLCTVSSALQHGTNM